MKQIVVASENPVKLAASKEAFGQMFPGETFTIVGHAVTSGVADQPHSDKETRQGAVNRAQAAKTQHPNADYWVGIEGGLESEDKQTIVTFAWVAVLWETKIGQARSASFSLPSAIVTLIKEGKELGEATDLVFADNNSKQKGGTVGHLTDGVIDRGRLYEPAVVLALIPFKKVDLYD